MQLDITQMAEKTVVLDHLLLSEGLGCPHKILLKVQIYEISTMRIPGSSPQINRTFGNELSIPSLPFTSRAAFAHSQFTFSRTLPAFLLTLLEHLPDCWSGTQAQAGYNWCCQQLTPCIWEVKLMEKPEQCTKSCLHHLGTNEVLHHPPSHQFLVSAAAAPRGRCPSTNLFPPVCFPGWQLADSSQLQNLAKWEG